MDVRHILYCLIRSKHPSNSTVIIDDSNALIVEVKDLNISFDLQISKVAFESPLNDSLAMAMSGNLNVKVVGAEHLANLLGGLIQVKGYPKLELVMHKREDCSVFEIFCAETKEVLVEAEIPFKVKKLPVFKNIYATDKQLGVKKVAGQVAEYIIDYVPSLEELKSLKGTTVSDTFGSSNLF